MLIATSGNCLTSTTSVASATLLVPTQGISSGKSTASSDTDIIYPTLLTEQVFACDSQWVSRSWLPTQTGEPSSTYPPLLICEYPHGSSVGAFFVRGKTNASNNNRRHIPTRVATLRHRLRS